jgi:hypothetical protein
MNTPTWIRHNNISEKLRRLEDREIIRGWQCQGDQPGTIWHVEGFTFSTRSMTTHECELFILGVEATWEAARVEATGSGVYMPALATQS